jgi:MFS family permease
MTLTAARVEQTEKPARSGLLLGIVLTGQFMAMLDVSVVNVALSTLQADLAASGAALQLIVGGYTIAYAVLLVTGARLGDLAGHRRMFLAGLGLFTLASLACGLAPGAGTLIGFRLAQGAGAALMVPQVLSLIQRSFDGPGRARALSVYATVIAGGAIAGQIAGGVLVDADIAGAGWRPAFLVNVPIGILLLIAGRRFLPADGRAGRTGRDPGAAGEPGACGVPGGAGGAVGRRGFDPAGLVTLAAAVLALVVPLVLGRELGWPAWCWVALGLSVVLFALFVRVESRAGASALIPLRLIRAPGLVGATVVLAAMMTAYGGYLFVSALHVQRGLGFGPLRAGLTFIPGALAFAAASLNWRRVPERLHRVMIAGGMVLAAVGHGVLAVALGDGSGPGAGFYTGMVLFGFGMGAAFSPLMTLALAGVPVADAADASGVLATVVQLAQVVGVATFGTLMLGLAGPFTPAASGRAFAATALLMAAVMAAGGAWMATRRATPPATLRATASP